MIKKRIEMEWETIQSSYRISRFTEDPIQYEKNIFPATKVLCKMPLKKGGCDVNMCNYKKKI
jgi:hypothetical protein